MIEIFNVTKNFGNKIAVNDISFKVEEGEIYSLLGPNGAGKTTTLKMIAGLLRPTLGTIYIDGFNNIKNHMEAKRKVSYVPDQPYLYEKLTGREFLDFVCDLFHPEYRGIEKKRRIEEVIEFFQTGEFIDSLCETYSHGMKQRVVLSAMLLQDAKYLVVDEPMVGLDPISTRLVKEMFKDMSRAGKGIILSTHVLSIAEQTALRIGIIHEGRLIAEGSRDVLEKEFGQHESLESLFITIVEKTHR